ncbi:MAG: UbiD family decarboxylase [Pseudorhodoplanes sp.]|uniref:UbiD family decarboxylase n=1 Tax=Pseudorhodoplanes sp. TaxID=1934341 RepID=UPI003D141AD2
MSRSGPEQDVSRRDPVGWRDLRQWLGEVEAVGELKRIAAPVDPIEEIGAITLLASRDEDSPALLFENMQGDATGSRILTNMLGSSKERYALAVGLDPSLSMREMIEATRSIMADPIKPVTIAKEAAPVNEVVLTGDAIDVTRFPVPQFWPGDGGRFIGTGDITFTASPDTGRINVGCYRQMLHGPNRIGLYCSPGKHGLLDREAWWARGEPCEVVAAYGIDPVQFMLAAQTFGIDQSELDVAGGIMGRPIELTTGEFVKLPIPAHAEFVVEGILHKGDVLPEGPLGEFTGYYGRERSPQPVMEIKAIHHRKSPIFTHALMARYPSCEIGAYYAIMRSARILDDLERIGVPGVVGAYSHPAAASGWGMVVVSLQQKYAGHSAQVLALAAQCPAAAYYTKWVIVVDDDVDPTDLNDVLWALSTRCHPSEDIDILRNTWSTGLDPSQFPPEARPYGSKVLINACKPHRHLAQFPQSTMLRKSVHDRVVTRWNELGFSGSPRRMTAFHPESE